MVDNFETRPAELRGEQWTSPELYRASENEPPVFAALPSIDELRALTPAELVELMDAYGVIEPLEVARSRAAAYIQRLTELKPGSDAFAQELERLVDAAGQQDAVNTARRVHQQWSTLDALQGVDEEMIWITQGDGDRVCPVCQDNGGEIKRYSEWLASGLPGAATCHGGDRCRCDLVVIS